MKTRRIFIIACGLIACILLLFSLSYWRYVQHLEKRRVENHCRVVASEMWDYDAKGMKEYFRLACVAYNYKSIVITYSTGEVFIDIDHSFQHPVDRLFVSLNLYPSKIIVSNVKYKDKILGQITVNWYNRIVYIFTYALLVGLLILTILWFYLRTVQSKNELEIRIDERTQTLKNEIIERKKTEKKLEKYVQRLAFHVEQTPLAVIEWDLNFKVSEWNQAAEKIFGFARIEALGKHSKDIIVPSGVNTDNLWKALITKKGGTRNTNQNITKDGELVICDWYNTTLCDADGIIIGVASMVLDITERVKSTERLRKSESSLKQATIAGNVGLWYWDLLTDRIHYSSVMKRQIGYEDLEIEGRYEEWESRIHQDDRARTRATVKASLAPPYPPYKVEFRLRHKDGSYRWILATGAHEFNKQMLPVRLMGAHIDITERKRAEDEKKQLFKQLLHAQKMEAIGILASGIAHDFNNILGAILGFVKLAKIDQEQPDKLNRDLREISIAAQRAANLVQQILTFSRQSDNEKQPLQVSLIVKEALKLVRNTIPKTITIKQDLANNAFIIADPTQIHQIIMNLCTNAYHAMRESGDTLNVALHEIEISENEITLDKKIEPGKYIKIEIVDNGHGIDEETQKKIFDPYFTSKKIGEGTGLGLWVVHGIVKSHDGHISVFSEPGIGTTFHIYLPIAHEAQLNNRQDEFKKINKNNCERILFVDDEKKLAFIAKEAFLNYGFKVDSFSDVMKALQVFKKDPDQYDVIITDMAMPAMNGMEFSKQVRIVKPNIPIILCTGFSELINKQKAMDMDIEYIQKPVAIDEIIRLVREIIDNSDA